MDRIKTYGTGEILQRIFAFIKPHLFLVIVNISVGVIGIGSSLFWAYALKEVTDAALGRDLDRVRWGVLIIASIMLTDIIIIYLMNYCSRLYAVRIMKDIRGRMFRNLEEVQMRHAESAQSGDIISRMTGDVGVLVNFIGANLGDILFIPLTIISAFIYMLSINWKLLVLCVIILPAAVIFANFLGRPIKKYSLSMMKHMGKFNSIAMDSIRGIHVIKSFNLYGIFSGKYKDSVNLALDESIKIAKRNSWLAPINMIINVLPLLLCVMYGGYLAVKGEMTAGELLAVFNLLHLITNPVSRLPGLLNQSKEALSSSERLLTILDFPAEEKGGAGFDMNTGEEAMIFDRLSFTYNDQMRLLNEISFTMRKGRVIALTGVSGSGKSTILKLLCGFYKPSEGLIKMFGRELHEWDMKAYRNNLAVVFQDMLLFPGTVTENIAYGRNIISMERIYFAAEAAGAHEFITSLPDGYDTLLGEQGSGISTGQKQRISIARAIFKDAPIIIMDEPASALDAQSEEALLHALDILKDDHAILVIAHSPATLQQADEIMVLENGCIAETGTHEELMKSGNIYRRLFEDFLKKDSPNNKREGDRLYACQGSF